MFVDLGKALGAGCFAAFLFLGLFTESFYSFSLGLVNAPHKRSFWP